MSIELVFQFLGEQWPLVLALAATLTMLVLHEGRKAAPHYLSMRRCSLLTQRAAYFWISGMPVISPAGTSLMHYIFPRPLLPIDAELEKFRDKPIVVVCKMGQSAGPATKTLRAQGFGRAQKLSGGMMEWDAQKLPVVTQ